jgi:hypothetical protein
VPLGMSRNLAHGRGKATPNVPKLRRNWPDWIPQAQTVGRGPIVACSALVRRAYARPSRPTPVSNDCRA